MKKLLISLMSLSIAATAPAFAVSCRTVKPSNVYEVSRIKVSNPDAKNNVKITGQFLVTTENTVSAKDLVAKYSIGNASEPGTFKINNLKMDLAVSSDKNKLGKAAPKTGEAKNIAIGLKFSFEITVTGRSTTKLFSVFLQSGDNAYNIVENFLVSLPGANNARQ